MAGKSEDVTGGSEEVSPVAVNRCQVAVQSEEVTGGM